MKHILCFGDSNTFGYQALTHGRYEYFERWTGCLQSLLGPSFRIIEEGCNHRTTVYEDAVFPGRAGNQCLPVCLDSHKPIDLVILCLGTNDLRTLFHVTSYDSAAGLYRLIRIIQHHEYEEGFRAPKILIVSPVEVEEVVLQYPHYGFTEDSIAKSRDLKYRYQEVASLFSCDFLDASEVASASQEDGLHLDVQNHWKLAAALAAKVQIILSAP